MANWASFVVSDLEARGILRVEDGNHGEYRPRSDEFVPKGTAFIRAADLVDNRIDFEHSSKISPTALTRIRKGVGAPGDVLLSHKGTVGRVAIAPLDSPPFVCSPQTTFWRTLDLQRVDRRFLRYFLESPDFREQLESRKNETDMAPYVSLTEQRKLRLSLPGLGEQRSIASILGDLDDKIESNRRLVIACVSLARQLLSQGLERCRVKQVATLEKGLSYKGAGLGAPDGEKMISLANFSTNGWLKWGELKLYGGEFKPKNTVRSGDLVIANTDLTQRRAILGQPGLVPSDLGSALFTHHVFAVRFFERPNLTLPLWAALNSEEFRDRAEGFATGTTVAALPKETVLDFEFGIPREQTISECSDLIERAWVAERETALLAVLRNALLAELLTGRLRVSEDRRVRGQEP